MRIFKIYFTTGEAVEVHCESVEFKGNTIIFIRRIADMNYPFANFYTDHIAGWMEQTRDS